MGSGGGDSVGRLRSITSFLGLPGQASESPCEENRLTGSDPTPAMAHTIVPVVGSTDTFVGTDEESQGTLDTIMRLSEQKGQLRTVVAECFNRASLCGRGLDVPALSEFARLASQVLHIPEEALIGSDAQITHLRFDFDGSGELMEREVHNAVTLHLAEYRKKLGQRISGVAIAHVPSLDVAGYREISEIGRGNQSTVHLAKDIRGRSWCIKFFDKTRVSDVALDSLRDEYEIMCSLGAHPRITEALDIFQDNNFYYVVQEYNAGGDFTKLRQRTTEASVVTSEGWWRDLFQQCFVGLRHLHDHAVIHCDIKESNLMLCTPNYHQPKIALADFGIAQVVAADRGRVVYGTPGYIAPEVWSTRKWFPRSDIFSMGVVVVQMMMNITSDTCSGTPPGIFTEDTSTYRDVAMATKTRQPPFHLMSPEFPGLVALARKLLDKSLRKRPMVSQLLGDPWFTCVPSENPPAAGYAVSSGADAQCGPESMPTSAELQGATRSKTGVADAGSRLPSKIAVVDSHSGLPSKSAVTDPDSRLPSKVTPVDVRPLSEKVPEDAQNTVLSKTGVVDALRGALPTAALIDSQGNPSLRMISTSKQEGPKIKSSATVVETGLPSEAARVESMFAGTAVDCRHNWFLGRNPSVDRSPRVREDGINRQQVALSRSATPDGTVRESMRNPSQERALQHCSNSQEVGLSRATVPLRSDRHIFDLLLNPSQERSSSAQMAFDDLADRQQVMLPSPRIPLRSERTVAESSEKLATPRCHSRAAPFQEVDAPVMGSPAVSLPPRHLSLKEFRPPLPASARVR